MSSQLHSLLKASGSLDKLRSAVQASSSNFKEDEGFWKMSTDKAGNGTAIIRFLPAPPPETIPFATFFRHAFNGPNGWYIELSRTTLGENDPVGEFNTRLWNTKVDTVQDQVRKQARKLTYVSNIYVVSDKGNPTNEGKVFLFRYGKKIFEKIQKAITPEFAEDFPFDPFHLLEGANFRLRQKKQAGFPNYDDSVFEAPSKLLKGDETALTTVVAQLRSLTEFVLPDAFKSYEELKKKLDRVMGFDTAVHMSAGSAGVTVDSVRSGGSSGAAGASGTFEPEPPRPTSARAWVPPVVATLDDESDEDARLAKFEED